MMVLLGLALVRRRWANGLVIGFVSLMGFWHLQPLLWRGDELGVEGERAFQVTGLNVLTSNRDEEAVLEHLREVGSDVLILIETDTRWVNVLKRGLPEYGESYSVPRGDNFGMLILSKTPFLKKIKLESHGVPILQVNGVYGGEKLAIIAVHPIPPIGKGFKAMNASYLEEVEELCHQAREQGMIPVVVGDFNATPWSEGYRRLMNGAALESAANGEGELTSWNRFKNRGVPFAGLLIDHILYGEGLKKVSFEVGPATGSDHFSVTAGFGL